MGDILGILHFASRREPFAWQINDDSVFLKGRAELIISPITWSGLVEIYSYHLPRTLEILRVMKGPPPAAASPGRPARRGGQGGRPNMAGAREAPAARAPGLRSCPPTGWAGHSLPPHPCPRFSSHDRIDVLVGTGGAINQKTGRGQS